MTDLLETDAKTVNDWLKDGRAILIDIREPNEYAQEHISGAQLVPLSRFDPEAIEGDHDKIAVFHCAGGSRTKMNAALLLATGFKAIYHLKGGIGAWKAAGLPTETSNKR